jgi:hypothetical protein
MKRTRIEPLENHGGYQISEENPNPGGETLCSPYHHGEDCRGPYLVFPRAHAKVVTNGHPVIPVLCLGAAKAAVLHVENGGEVGQVGSGRRADRELKESGELGTPSEPLEYTTVRLEYQLLAAKTSLLELPSWDEYVASKGLEPGGTASGLTEKLAVNGIDPDAKPLTEVH